MAKEKSAVKEKVFEFDAEVTIRFTMKAKGTSAEDAKEKAREKFQNFAELIGSGGVDLGEHIIDMPLEVGIDFDPSDDIEDDDIDPDDDPGEYDESELDED